MSSVLAGYRERAHTADWELEVWGAELSALLEQAARGMYALMSARLQPGPRLVRRLVLQAYDREGLLVSFLAELLWICDQEGLGFDTFEIKAQAHGLEAQLTGAPIESRSKEIKAVTYHNLVVRETGRGLEANLVFDV